MATNAAAQVFGIVELLEMVLVQQVSPPDVISVHRVNKFCHAAVNGSRKLCVARVLGNKRLLDKILCYSNSPRCIIRARQVNTYFKGVIDQSKKLRPILFLEPDPDKLVISTADSYPHLVSTATYRYLLALANLPDTYSTELHPAIRAASFQNFGLNVTGHGYWAYLKPSIVLTWLEGPWMNALLSQPPCDGFVVKCHRYDGSGCHCEGDTKYGNGVRLVAGNALGDLRNEILRLRCYPDNLTICTNVVDHDDNIFLRYLQGRR